ncbi:MAG: carbon-nitrogen hydrolase family protein [Clostridiales bacterium]|nr:carbon-nitrogen hydrolase family protein [Clostridiales bacterium]
MKIALASALIIDRDIPFNLSQMEKYMQEAKANGACLVCFGEAFLQGFNALSWQFEKDRKTALSTESEEFAKIKAWSTKIGIDVLFGYNELDGDRLYSSCALIANGELLRNYRRISKGWKEYSRTDLHYQEGEIVDIFDYHGKKCVIALCGDVWDFPERFALGEDILFWPVYVSWTREEWENGGKKEYAEQAKRCCPYTLYVNSLCREDAFGGAAMFANGSIPKELPLFQEGLLYADV